MTREYLQKLAASEQHLKHIAFRLIAEHLNEATEDIVGNSLYTYDYDPEEDPEAYAEQEQLIEVYTLFEGPVTRTIEKFTQELKDQATALEATCICVWPDDKRVYPAVSALLHQLPLPGSTAFRRDDDEGYRLVVNDELIFEHLGPDEAIEATRQYVEMRTLLGSPSRKEDLN